MFNRKAAGGWSITLHIIWAAIVTGAVVLVNFAATEEFNFEVLEMTYAPYVGVVLLIVSAIIWGTAKKDIIAIRALKNAPQSMPVQTPVNPAYAMPAAEPVVASSDSMLFDNSVENEVEEVAQEEKEELVFCAYCGNQIAASAAFCKHCGAKKM